jgi:hypothetical protein
MTRGAAWITALALVGLVLAPCVCPQAPEADAHACCAPELSLRPAASDCCPCAAGQSKTALVVVTSASLSPIAPAPFVMPQAWEVPRPEAAALLSAPACASPPTTILRI